MKKKEKKVLLLSYRLGYDSLLYWDSILTSIRKEFNSFRVFTSWPSLMTDNKEVSTEEELRGIKYYHNKDRLNQKLYFFPLPFFIYKIIKFKPDVIILNEFNITNFYTVLFKIFYKNSNILLLVESDPGIGKEDYKEKKFRKLLRRFIISRVDKVLTNNNLGFIYLTNYLGSRESKVVVAPYLTSCPPDKIISQKPNNKKMINFLYVGQLVERKGLIYLLKALSLLPEEMQKIISVNIVGGGNLRSSLELFAKDQNMNFVNFLGKVPFEELNTLYQDADCFILPTLHDYRALVGFEAIHYGCSIITSIYDGSRFEIVKDDLNGYIVDPQNIEEFKEAIEKIVIDNEKREIFKKNSLSLSKNYTLEICNNNLINEIKKLSKNVLPVRDI